MKQAPNHARISLNLKIVPASDRALNGVREDRAAKQADTALEKRKRHR